MEFNSAFKGLNLLEGFKAFSALFRGTSQDWPCCIVVEFFFSVALRPNAGHGLLILEVSRSHTTTHHSR